MKRRSRKTKKRGEKKDPGEKKKIQERKQIFRKTKIGEKLRSRKTKFGESEDQRKNVDRGKIKKQEIGGPFWDLSVRKMNPSSSTH